MNVNIKNINVIILPLSLSSLLENGKNNTITNPIVGIVNIGNNVSHITSLKGIEPL
jgi:hypothetical protein